MNRKVLLGKKIGMTQIFDENGKVIPVTVIHSEGCKLIKKVHYDTKSSILVGYEVVPDKKLTKPLQGFFKKQKSDGFRFLAEFEVSADFDPVDGAELGVHLFDEGDTVSIRSKSIGRGFSGTIKRWNFSRGPMTHGSKSHRIPGSIGGGTTPGRVIKGKKMPGQCGNAYTTVKNLIVVKIDSNNNLLFLKGSVPGKKNNLVYIKAH
jgi:large subunit ribosomal protein L3